MVSTPEDKSKQINSEDSDRRRTVIAFTMVMASLSPQGKKLFEQYRGAIAQLFEEWENLKEKPKTNDEIDLFLDRAFNMVPGSEELWHKIWDQSSKLARLPEGYLDKYDNEN